MRLKRRYAQSPPANMEGREYRDRTAKAAAEAGPRAAVADKAATVVFYAGGLSVVLILCCFAGYVIATGWHSLNIRFLTTPPKLMAAGGGIGPQLFNSFYLLFLSLLISCPIGLGAGIYLAEYAPRNRITDAIRLSLETLSSLPSIAIGLFGLIVFVNLMGWGFSLSAGAMALMILNLPIITRVTEEAIRAVPAPLKEGSLALGATRWQTIRRLVLPMAASGIISGAILVAGRVFGEAAALLYTAGMSSPPLSFTDLNPLHPASPLNPFRPAETLAVYTWKVNSEGLAPDARQIADGASAVLILTVFTFNIIARFFARGLRRHAAGL